MAHDHSSTATGVGVPATAAKPVALVPVLGGDTWPGPWLLATLFLAIGLSWGFALAWRHLLPADEGRYAEIAREMLASGDWVTVRYQGLKYFEKPPLQIWMTALAFKAFGLGEWQARLWTALCAMGATGAIAWAARRWFGPRAGIASAVVLLAMPLWVLGGQYNSLDMGVSAALTVVLSAFLIAEHPATSPSGQRFWMCAAWAAMAAAVLTKGLIGIVLPGLALIGYSLLARDLSIWRRLQWTRGLAVFLLIAAPWFALVSVRNPEFPHFFFVHEHFERYTSGVHQRGAPWWFYAPLLAIGCLPWTGLGMRLARNITKAVGNAWLAPALPTPQPTAALRSGKALNPQLLLAAWAGSIALFFSASGSKLPGYIFPVLPALAMLVAVELNRIERSVWQRQLLALALLAVAATLACPWLAQSQAQEARGANAQGLYAQYADVLMVACATAALGVGWAWKECRDGRTTRSVLAVALGFYGFGALAVAGHESLGREASGIDLVAPIAAELSPDMPLYGVRLLDHTLPFYLRHTLVMVESPDELAFGVAQEPLRWLPTVGAFEQAWTSGQPAMAILSAGTLSELAARGFTGRVVAQDAHRVVLANFKKTPARTNP